LIDRDRVVTVSRYKRVFAGNKDQLLSKSPCRTPDVAVVISLNNFLGPVDDTVTAQKCSTSTSTCRRASQALFGRVEPLLRFTFVTVTVNGSDGQHGGSTDCGFGTL